MVSTFWERVRANGLRVPGDRPLAELTAELTTMLGDPDPAVRDGLACPTLETWVGNGVYDDLLTGLGDGMAAGLRVGLGEDGTDTVYRRSYSARVLTACLVRDQHADLVPADTVLGWGDRLAGWLVRERDLRGYVPGRGWAHALAHGADALAALARSRSLGRLELTVLLDVVADRLLAPTPYHLTAGECDRLARATMVVLRRGLVGPDVVEPWLARLAAHAQPTVSGETDPYRVTGNVQAFLRALHLALALTTDPPADRADLLLVLIEHLRHGNPQLLSD